MNTNNKIIRISFVCVQNSCRSQIAEYLANKFNTSSNLRFSSCGTKLADKINPRAIEIISKLYGDDISNQVPKTIDNIEKPDLLISMGCEVSCPIMSQGYYDNWQLPDPVKLPDEEFIQIIKKIENKVKVLINKLGA